MASLPGYYISDPSQIVYLPVIEDHEATLGPEVGAIDIETGGGKHWVYIQFEREWFRLTFVVDSFADLQKFRDMHDAVKGIPFYYVDSDRTTTYVRKQLSLPYTRQKALSRFVIHLDLSQEPTPAELEA